MGLLSAMTIIPWSVGRFSFDADFQSHTQCRFGLSLDVFHRVRQVKAMFFEESVSRAARAGP
jgi:hypothetical protein